MSTRPPYRPITILPPYRLMRRLALVRLLCLSMLTLACSCTSMNIARYYRHHRATLDGIETTYRTARQIKPFSIEFTDRPFDHVSLELITDTLTYIYEFSVGESRLRDSLIKYGYDPTPIDSLITTMRSVQCTWIDNLDYYTGATRHSMTYISLWPRAFNRPFVNKKYYILTYFEQPQYFDSEGRLLAGRRLKRIRRINGDVFRRINDKVCYTISDRFR
jgi:hypothetical protein